MKIFAYLHTYGHNRTSGADVYAQSLLEWLAAKGCKVIVGIKDSDFYILNGVLVQKNILIAEHFEWADVIITHLIFNNPALEIARRFNKPVIHLAHNAENRTNEGYIIYNSESLKASLQLPLKGIVVQPPTYLKDWQNEIDHYHAKYITLVNCCFNKGAETLKALAQWLPQYQFLGVHGAYGKQMIMPAANLTYRPFSEKMNYDDTRILIVPSKKESWSLAAAEAMASGIPVICSGLPGLRENLGCNALYADSVGEFVQKINVLQDREIYNGFAEFGKKRIAERNQEQQLENMYNFISEIAMPKNKITVKVEKRIDLTNAEFIVWDEEKS